MFGGVIGSSVAASAGVDASCSTYIGSTGRIELRGEQADVDPADLGELTLLFVAELTGLSTLADSATGRPPQRCLAAGEVLPLRRGRSHG